MHEDCLLMLRYACVEELWRILFVSKNLKHAWMLSNSTSQGSTFGIIWIIIDKVNKWLSYRLTSKEWWFYKQMKASQDQKWNFIFSKVYLSWSLNLWYLAIDDKQLFESFYLGELTEKCKFFISSSFLFPTQHEKCFIEHFSNLVPVQFMCRHV